MNAQGLASELTDLGKAIGLIQDNGDLNAAWFSSPNGPLDHLASMLQSPQREALLRLFSALLPPVSLGGLPDNESWHPLLGDQPRGNVYITVKDTGGAAVLGVAGDVGSSAGAAGITAQLRAQLPLVSANTGVHAIAGTASGPLKLQLRVALPPLANPLKGIVVEASIAPPNESVTVMLQGLALAGAPPKDVVLDPANLGHDASQLIVALLKQVLSQLAATVAPGTEAAAVVHHLTGLLGLDGDGVPAFPITDLATNPAALQNWLRGLASGAGAAMQMWLGHLAGLIGASGVAIQGSGTAIDPWTLQVLPFNASSGFAITASQDADSLRLGVRASLVPGGANPPGRVDADAVVASIPLHGAGSAKVLPSASVLFQAPGTIGGPDLATSAAITVGSLRGGVSWDGASLRPLLQLTDVTMSGPPAATYPKIDLTDTDSVAAAATAAVRAAILAALGNGAGAQLAALAGLIAPSGDPASPHLADLRTLVSNPARAIAAFHRAVLLDATHNWSFLMQELAGLIGINTAVTGAGTFIDPWRVPLAPGGPITLELGAYNAQTNPAAVQQLRLGLRASVSAAPIQFFWLAELLAFDLPASGEGDVRVMGGQHLVFLVNPGPSTPPLSDLQISAGSFRAQMDWQPGSSMSWLAEVDNLAVTVTGTTVNVASLRFPIPGGFDVGNPAATAAAAGVSIPNLELLLRLLLMKAALSWGNMPGFVLTGLLGVHKSFAGLPADWPTLADPGAAGSLLSNPFGALRQWLAHIAADRSADGTPFLPTALSWLQAFASRALPDSPSTALVAPAIAGSGTYDDPWALPLSTDRLTSDLLVWLEPNGPPSAWAAALSTAAGAATDFNSLLAIVAQLAAFAPAADDAVRAADLEGIALGLVSLATHFSSSDGVVPAASQIPAGGTWTAGTAITAAHSQQPHDASAISQILAQVDTLAGGAASPRVVLLLGPAFSDHAIWTDLLNSPRRHGTTDPSATFNLRVPGIDPAVVNLSGVTAAVDYFTADLADNGTGDITSLSAQIGRVVDRIGVLQPGVPVTLVAHSTAGVAARTFTNAFPAKVKGLITLGTPHFGASLPFLNDPNVTRAIRFVQGLRAGMTAGSPLRDALDHIAPAMDGFKDPDGAGTLPVPAPYPAGSFTGSANTDTGGKPAFALGGTISGNLLDLLKQAAAAVGTQAVAAARPAPTHLAFGIRAHLALPAASRAAVNVDASVRTSVFRVKLNAPAPDPPHSAQAFGARIELSRPDGFLVGTAALGDVRVRRCDFGLDIQAGASAGQLHITPFVDLRQAAFHGKTISRVSIGDSSAQLLLGEVMHAISEPAPVANAPAAVLLNALQSLGIAGPDPHGGIGILADAFNAITTDAASFFSARIAGALSTPGGVLGFSGPAAGPWTYVLDAVPLAVTITASPFTLSLGTTDTGLALASNASLQLSAGVGIPSLAPNLSATFTIGVLSLNYTSATSQLTASAQPWLAPIRLLPAPTPATLTAALNDALPRLLFSAAGGALLEGLLGKGFSVLPLDMFFSNTGGTAQQSGALGNNSGTGLDSGKINRVLQIFNNLAGFAASPGITIPPGIQLNAAGAGTDPDPLVFHLGTTAPIGGIFGVQLTATIDKFRHVTPGGTLSVTTPLAGTWPSATITFGFTGSQVMLSIAPQGIPAIQILPTFSGLGALRGAIAALLPQALDALVQALSVPGPAPAWLTSGLSVAQALELYDNAGHFAAHASELHTLLDGNFLSLFNPAQRASVATAVAGFLNGLGAFPSAVTAVGSTVNWQLSLGGGNTGTVGLTLGWDGSGPVAQLSATGVKLANGAIITTLSAGFANGALCCSTDLSVSLLATLGINLAPKFSASVAGSAFQVTLHPLATGSGNGPLHVTLTPSPGVQSDAGTPEQLITNFLIPLAGDVIFEAAKSKLPTVLWTGGPTLETALVAAGIVHKGATPPQDTLISPLPGVTTMVAGLATALLPSGLQLTPNLKLQIVHHGNRIGIALQGHIDFPVSTYLLSVRFGAPDSWAAVSPGANDGIVVFMFTDAGAFNPGLLVAGLGLGLAGAGDAPLANLSGFRLGGFTGYLFFDAELQSGLTVNSFGGGLELAELGLPLGLATGGNVGGNNPVASSLMRSDGGSSGNPGDTHPVNPGVDVDAWFWSGPAGDNNFHILFGGQGGAIWIPIHAGFGPVFINQLGLEIGAADVDLLIDGSVKVDGLTAQCHELTIQVPYRSIMQPSGWSLDLKGLAVGFESPGVTIAGALVKSDGPPVEYDGLLLIKIGDLGFIAVGAYSTPKDPSTGDTYTSLFVFAGVFIQIGIPPIIEISGLGLGVGYNREIIVPTDLNKIPTFLLVEVLDNPDKIADDPMGALMGIRGQLPARRGSFWLAVGLRGTSFQIVHVTAILYIALDRGVEIGILGVARMALPADDSALVSIELALKVRLSTAEQMFSIQAQLTDNSYLLSRDCQLTGGFAYFVWFAESQFLLTIGGYHPAFHRRPEFPDVPRLGYHWSFLGVVAIKGESYFALTNTCIMAGTRFDATYGPSWLFVWFSAWCDFLISWDPFYYDISIGISVGATFRIHICFFGCVDIDITVSIGASLHVLGPPFHGEVTVDLAVASVTVPFGPNPNQPPKPIGWNDFVSQYLHSSPGNEAVLAHIISGLQPPEPAGGQPSPGTPDQPWKFMPEFSFRTETRMPARSFTFLTPNLKRDESQIASKVFGQYGPLLSTFSIDIAAMAVDHTTLQTMHVLFLDGWDSVNKGWTAILPSDNPLNGGPEFTVDAANPRFKLEPIIGQVSQAIYQLFAHDNVPAGAQTLPVITGLKVTGFAVLENPSATVSIKTLFDYGFSRPLPFATWSPGDLAGLIALGNAAESLLALATGAGTKKILNASSKLLSGSGFFADARVATGLAAPGLPSIATRSLKNYRSAPPLIAPITTGLTMKPVGQAAPPAIQRIGNVPPVMLNTPRLRAVLQGRPVPTMDAPPVMRTSVVNVADAKNAPRLAAPQLNTLPGARLHRIHAESAPRPTRLARSTRTLRSADIGSPLGPAHLAQFRSAEKLIIGNGVSVPAGATHVWDVPAVTPAQNLTVAIAGISAARVTSLSRGGYVLDDREFMPGGAPLTVPTDTAMIAVTCLGNAPVGGGANAAGLAAPPAPGLGAIAFTAGNRSAIVGWQTGNLAPQVGSRTLLGCGCCLILPQPALTTKSRQPAAQAMVRLSEALVDQIGVETWLPTSISVIGVILDIKDACANDDGDLNIAVTGATLATPPVRVAGGQRKLLLYDIASRDPHEPHISISVVSKEGVRMAGIVGLGGRAQEWGVRLNGGVPEHWVSEGPLTPDGAVSVRIRIAPGGNIGGD